MTHVEFLENLIEEYKKEFKEDPPINKNVESFREGMIFAWRLAIIKLKKGKC